MWEFAARPAVAEVIVALPVSLPSVLISGVVFLWCGRSAAENRAVSCRSDFLEHASKSSISPVDFDAAAPMGSGLTSAGGGARETLADQGFCWPFWWTGGPS